MERSGGTHDSFEEVSGQLVPRTKEMLSPFQMLLHPLFLIQVHTTHLGSGPVSSFKIVWWLHKTFQFIIGRKKTEPNSGIPGLQWDSSTGLQLSSLQLQLPIRFLSNKEVLSLPHSFLVPGPLCFDPGSSSILQI